MTRAEKYFRYILPGFGNGRTKEILNVNPTTNPGRKEPERVFITIYDYNENTLEEVKLDAITECYAFKENQHISWINIDGLRKHDVELISEHFGIHPLITEDILSSGQRPKMDEVDDILYCLMNMLYFDDNTHTVEQEQISIVLGKDFVITFQEDAHRDVFDPIRDKLKLVHSKLRQRGSDYLAYSMIDLIVDNYFFVMEKLGEMIEQLEEEVIRRSDPSSLARINQLRKELIILKRNIAPVRDLVGNIIRSDSPLLGDRIARYFKDVQDHITQAYELNENYRDIIISMQDLYINNVNLKMNEVMKVLAIVTCLLAPATVIGGIFGMNFDTNVTFFHKPWGFYMAVAFMLLIPIWMLWVFKKRKWF